MLKEEFVEIAGGVFTRNKSWSRLSSREKRSFLWNFYRFLPKDAYSIYGGFDVRKLKRDKLYSVEHIIPRSIIRHHLVGVQRNGAECNPLNLAPSHTQLNQLRQNNPFDLEEDLVARSLSLEYPSIHNDSVGLDAQNEWVLPARSKGDIARSILYMNLTYGIPLSKEERSTMKRWAKRDRVSNMEKQFNEWSMERWAIQNPFVTHPDIIDDTNLVG
ncbi:MAG: endonuclease [Myxococcota bacterium]|nr:endonuclease [Myxococcota bacterium]